MKKLAKSLALYSLAIVVFVLVGSVGFVISAIAMDCDTDYSGYLS